MEYILQKPTFEAAAGSRPLWVVLHGAYDVAGQAVDMFGQEAEARQAFLLAPQASRPCGDGFCWSFARDAAAIKELLADVRANLSIHSRSYCSASPWVAPWAVGGWRNIRKPLASLRRSPWARPLSRGN